MDAATCPESGVDDISLRVSVALRQQSSGNDPVEQLPGFRGRVSAGFLVVPEQDQPGLRGLQLRRALRPLEG